MKKTLAILLALALVAGVLAGCADKPAPAPSPEAGQNEPAPTGEAASEAPAEEGPGAEAQPGTAAPYEGEPGEYVPDYSFYSAGLTEEGFFAGVTAADIVELPAYKGIAVPAAARAVDPEELDYFLRTQILAPYAETVEVTDRAVENYDTVNIDYTGYMDDVAFDGGSTMGMGTEVVIGVTGYIDDFLEQLIGHLPGETFDIFVTFPDPYPNNQDLAGREARFNVTINCILESSEVELTDAIAREYGFDSKTALLARVEEILLNEARAALLSEVLAQAVCPEIPESVTTYFEDYLIGYYSVSYGMDLSDSREEMLAGSEEMIRSMALTYLAAQAICEKEGLRASDADLDAIGILPLLDTYGLPYARQTALMNVVLPKFLIANGSPAP